MSKSFFSVPPAIALSIKEGRERIAEAIAAGNPPEIFNTSCDRCGASAWEYRWGNHWRCVECGVWTDAPAPEGRKR